MAALIMLTLVATGKKPAASFVLLYPTAIVTWSNSSNAEAKTSMCPRVNGSKEPGKIALRSFINKCKFVVKLDKCKFKCKLALIVQKKLVLFAPVYWG